MRKCALITFFASALQKECADSFTSTVGRLWVGVATAAIIGSTKTCVVVIVVVKARGGICGYHTRTGTGISRNGRRRVSERRRRLGYVDLLVRRSSTGTVIQFRQGPRWQGLSKACHASLYGLSQSRRGRHAHGGFVQPMHNVLRDAFHMRLKVVRVLVGQHVSCGRQKRVEDGCREQW